MFKKEVNQMKDLKSKLKAIIRRKNHELQKYKEYEKNQILKDEKFSLEMGFTPEVNPYYIARVFQLALKNEIYTDYYCSDGCFDPFDADVCCACMKEKYKSAIEDAEKELENNLAWKRKNNKNCY